MFELAYTLDKYKLMENCRKFIHILLKISNLLYSVKLYFKWPLKNS